MTTTKNPWHRANEPGMTTLYVKRVHVTTYLKKIPHLQKQAWRNGPVKPARLLAQELPSPETYYRNQFPRLSRVANSRWVSVHCCFHEDKHPSLRIHLTSGAFRCFGCGIRGSNILAFHQKRYGTPFSIAGHSPAARRKI